MVPAERQNSAWMLGSQRVGSSLRDARDADRNRQVIGSSPIVGSNFSSTYVQFTETCCTTAARAILASSCFMALVTTSGTVLM